MRWSFLCAAIASAISITIQQPNRHLSRFRITSASDNGCVEVLYPSVIVSRHSLHPPADDLIANQSRCLPNESFVQIVYESSKTQDEHGRSIRVDGWGVYFGPQGQPVNPCAYLPFSKLRHAPGIEVADSSIDNPPYPRVGIWAGLPNLHEDVPCLIICDGGNLPRLRCAKILDSVTVLEKDFATDPWFDETSMECTDGTKHHRGCYVEYSMDG